MTERVYQSLRYLLSIKSELATLASPRYPLQKSGCLGCNFMTSSTYKGPSAMAE